MTPSKDIARLIEIMAALRDPQTGCPWDAQQDFSTIAPYTIEEAYEVADAIERDDAVDLREELGDLLLQVVYHCRLAEEKGLFGFGDVVETITAKMVRRHPHVFGDAEARSARSAKGQWERIKAQEKAARAAARDDAGQPARLSGMKPSIGDEAATTHFLDDVPRGFPALTLADRIQKKAASAGFDWGDAEPVYAKIVEETAEFREAADRKNARACEDELGDLLFSVVNLARCHDIDPEAALRRCVAKFRSRFDYIEDGLALRGTTLAEASLEAMETLWQEAKRRPGEP